MISIQRTIPSLAFVLALGAVGRVWAAECPIVRPITGAFRAVRVDPGTVVNFPPQAGTAATNRAELHKGMTLSGAITGLSAVSPGEEMGLTLKLDLVRYLGTGQGYGSGEVTISTRPATPFLSASTAFRGHLDAVVTAGNQLTGTFCAVGDGEYIGSSVRGRFTARLTTTTPAPGPSPDPNPSPIPNPFGSGPTNPLVPGPGSANPFTSPSGPPTNPFATPPGTTTASLVALEIAGGFGSAGAPTIVVDHDPVGMVVAAGAPDLSGAATGLFPLVQPSKATLSINCTGGTLKFCPAGGIPTAKEGVETRAGMAGKGSISVRAGKASARYRVELALDCVRTTGGDPGDNDFGYAQGRIRFFAREPAPVYEGTLEGAVTPLFVRGRLVRNRYVWSGFAVLNGRPTPDGRVIDSLRSTFTVIATYTKSRTAPVRLQIVLGDRDDPFVRVMSGLPNR